MGKFFDEIGLLDFADQNLAVFSGTSVSPAILAIL
jgi:hypothetical protein